MDISSIYANAGYTNHVSKSSNTQKTSNTEKTEQTTEMTDAEKLENFKKEIWNEIDKMPWDNRMSISIQITDKAFERMMNDEEFKNKMMSLLREDCSSGHPPIVDCMDCIDENGYSGYSYNDSSIGDLAFSVHSKDKECFYSKKRKRQDYNELYEKERQQKKLQQEKLGDVYWDSVDLKRTLLKKEQASKAYESKLLS